jgi:cellulose synthase/poly-beta-1,6-N-acetylglucosamine synthase-like glycosyltransferase
MAGEDGCAAASVAGSTLSGNLHFIDEALAQRGWCHSEAALFEARRGDEEELLHGATHALRRDFPEYSAASPLVPWQRRLPFVIALATAGFVGFAPELGQHVAAILLALPFFMIVLIRVAALWHLTTLAAPHSSRSINKHQIATDDALPFYSILVPLYREVAVVPNLIAGLSRLDYPRDRLEIILLTEQDDPSTRIALERSGLRVNMRVVTVPVGQPKTKPRALNYGLQLARGELIAIFDAEDIPEPQQLRCAVSAFAMGDDQLACVQARLNIYNPGQSALTRQFAIEYAALFEAILPALDRLDLPLPLGGTSNHFRRSHLIAVGAWDPFNVTEDADLGFRLARHGYKIAMVDTTTWEEAPLTARAWLGQRTRWLKGWMQTYLVHMRDPSRLWSDLGAWRFWGLQMTLGGMVLSALVHPWVYVILVINLASGGPLLPEASHLWWLCVFNLFAGYVAGLGLAALAVKRRGGRLLMRSVAWLPLYWIAISFAAYRAVFDFILRPYYWEKTPHGLSGVTTSCRAA